MTTRVDPVMHDQTRTSRSILALVAVARVGVGAAMILALRSAMLVVDNRGSVHAG
jgi:hypothetical protein